MTDSALDKFAAMIGEWRTNTDLYPGVVGGVTIEWFADGAFLVARYTTAEPGNSRVWVVGTDDAYPDRLKVLQHDSHGERRIFNGSFEGPLWRVYRDAPGDSQRLTGSLDETGNTFLSTWERSDSELDPRVWEHELDIVYTRIS